MEKLGLSGDLVLFKSDKILKICKTDQSRFTKNINKQITFNELNINSVPILKQGTNEQGELFIEMPILKCDNAIIWISKATSNQIIELEKNILQYFNSIIDKSILKEFDYLSWQNKLNDLYIKINDIKLQEVIFYLQNIKFQSEFYYGNYHGDLTLTNLFISNEGDNIKIDAIDFLESFIASPTNDLVKMRQDTKHLWTLQLIQNFTKIDLNRVLILLNHIDEKISKFIEKNEILKEYYIPFQIINLLRILPYNKDEKVFEYLKNEICELFKELKGK